MLRVFQSLILFVVLDAIVCVSFISLNSTERFDCGNGRSVPYTFLCDRDDDCGNGADERNCTSGRYECGNGRDVPTTYMCDGDDDCGNGADERNCSHVRFDCGNGRSVTNRYICDGDNDCGNGADERNCSSILRSTITGTSTSIPPVPDCVKDFLFDCGNGRYIRKNMICNRYNDCGNYADEQNCNYPRIGLTTPAPMNENISLTLKQEEFIYSPNYPSDYSHFSNIFWNVTTAPGYRINLVFKDFELEDSNDCISDYLKLYDGHNTKSPLGTYCRHTGILPPPVMSTSNALNVHFKTDSSVTWRGFNLSITPICGGVLQAQSSENALVSHPKFGDEFYGENVSCGWILRSRTERNIELKFQSFEVGNISMSADAEGIAVSICENTVSGDCVQYNEPQDYVEIFDGPDDTNKKIGKFFGNQAPPTITSQGEELFIRFRSGQNSRSRGFSATYKQI